jgi:hypothetical protein
MSTWASCSARWAQHTHVCQSIESHAHRRRLRAYAWRPAIDIKALLAYVKLGGIALGFEMLVHPGNEPSTRTQL